MPKRDLQDSVIKKCEEIAHSLKVVREDIKKITNYERSLTTKILDHCEIYDITNDELESFSIVETTQKKSISLKEILDVFPNDDVRVIIENVVAKIDIDIEATKENLKYSGEFQDILVNKIIKQLDRLSKETVKVVVLK